MWFYPKHGAIKTNHSNLACTTHWTTNYQKTFYSNPNFKTEIDLEALDGGRFTLFCFECRVTKKHIHQSKRKTMLIIIIIIVLILNNSLSQLFGKT